MDVQSTICPKCGGPATLLQMTEDFEELPDLGYPAEKARFPVKVEEFRCREQGCEHEFERIIRGSTLYDGAPCSQTRSVRLVPKLLFGNESKAGVHVASWRAMAISITSGNFSAPVCRSMLTTCAAVYWACVQT